jgi:hypothetical protein
MKAKVRSVPRGDYAELLRTSVRGGNLTVGDALDYREATLDEVIEDKSTGTFIASATTVYGHVLSALGHSQHDAVERLATLALRP